MEHQTFADGIGRIAIIDGIVRLDLVAHSPTEAGTDGKPRAVFTHRIVMGVDQFLRAAEKIAETTKVIRNNTAPQAAAAAPPAPTQPSRPAAPTNQPQTVPPQFRRESIHPDRPAASPASPQRPFP
ncbi:MAG: hypothetical protein JWP16_36 [Alphaproteobacteria bacterium]|jgi:hypothetical protein|nr:hypothetical protein [Alphaproteobacteria bacterium]MDB5738996.1 hypothetical protein [Alphaproteobacteria bacterium]